MLYTLALGPSEQSIAKQAYRSGQEIPDRILNAPELILGLQLYIDAFFDLDSERSHTFGYVRIPFSRIRDYGEGYNYDDEQIADLLCFIPRMDTAYIDYLKTKRDINDANADRSSKKTGKDSG